MRTATWLRIASALTLLQALGHIFGALLASPSQGASEIALRDAMKAYRVVAMNGHSYWDFYFGSGLNILVFLLTLTAIMWYAARIANETPRLARPVVASLAVGYMAVTVVCALYFVTAPMVVAAAISACLVAALLTMRTAPGSA